MRKSLNYSPIGCNENMLQNYHRDDVQLVADDDAPIGIEEVERLRELLTTFLRTNCRLFNIEQLTSMLGVSPVFIQEVVTPAQFAAIGTRPTATIVFIRDQKDFLQDVEEHLATPEELAVVPSVDRSLRPAVRHQVVSLLPESAKSISDMEMEEVLSDNLLMGENNARGLPLSASTLSEATEGIDIPFRVTKSVIRGRKPKRKPNG